MLLPGLWETFLKLATNVRTAPPQGRLAALDKSCRARHPAYEAQDEKRFGYDWLAPDHVAEASLVATLDGPACGGPHVRDNPLSWVPHLGQVGDGTMCVNDLIACRAS